MTDYVSTNARRCGACFKITCDGWKCMESSLSTVPITYADRTLTFTGVIEASQGHTEGTGSVRGGNGWGMAASILTVLLGLVLVGMGLVFQDPVARAVWSWLS